MPDREPTIVYVSWSDASHDMEEREVEAIQLAELEEIGFLLHEDDEKLVLSSEWQNDNPAARLWLAIPKVNVTKRYDATLRDLLKWLKRKNG